MIETQGTTTQQVLRLAPFLDGALELIHAHQQRGDGEPKSYYIDKDAAHRCSRLTQLYQEVVLTKTYGVHIISTSKCIRADQEMKERIALVTELPGFDLRTGDPGIALLKYLMSQADPLPEIPGPNSIGFESIEEATDIFTTITDYFFLTKRRKKLESQFKDAEARMRCLVEYYHLQGQFTWNQGMKKGGGKVRTRANTAFFNDYLIGTIE